MLMNDFNEQFRTADIGGFLSWTSRLNELKAHLFRELGIDALYAYPEEGDAPPEPSDMESFVLRRNGSSPFLSVKTPPATYVTLV
jgi:hypothetical protein